VRKTALLNPFDELALIQPEPISAEWTGEPSFGFVLLARELRRNIRVYPDCKLWRALLSLEAHTQTILYASLIKGWSSRRIAETLDISPITIQELLEDGREDLKRRLVEPHYSATVGQKWVESRSTTTPADNSAQLRKQRFT
jgi:hypothetical protein